MFWTNNYVSSPHIDALLNKENVTLHELMDEEDILQECKSQNKKLVEYLTRPEVMEELVILTTKEPSLEVEERWRYKYPNVACELLTCDVPMLNEKLAGDESLLTKLYSFIDTEPPLNPLLASFFSKTIGVLVARKSDQHWYSYQFTCLQVLEFLKSRQHCVDLLLQHLETSAIMDLVLKLVTQVEGSEMRQNILNWLDGQHLVERLVKLLSPTLEIGRHANAAQLLCDMIKAGRENCLATTERSDPDPILNRLESTETVSLLLETILSGEKSESSIVGGIEVLLVLLGQRSNNALNVMDNHGNGAGEDSNDNEQRIKITVATLPYLGQLHNLLTEPPHKPAVKTTAGRLELPLGNTRLHVAKLLVALLSTENAQVRETLADLGTFQVLLDLFFKYAYNNFLHTQVEQCIALAINTDVQEMNNVIYDHIFIKCKIIERILGAWQENETKQGEEKGIRQGYMGHLINIANNIVTQCEKNNILQSFLKTNLSPDCLTKWEALATNQLADINKIHKIYLGGQQQPYITSSEENSDDYISYPHSVHVQQMYDNYQTQQMTSEFMESCTFNDDKLNDGEETLHNSVDEVHSFGFNLNEEDLDKGEEMFNKVCEQKQKAGLDESCGVGEWGDEGDLTFQTVIDKRNWPSKQLRQNSNSFSDDDEDEPQDLHMEVDSTDPWDSAQHRCRDLTIPPSNPWDVVNQEESEQTGWANFDNFESTLNIDENAGTINKPTDVTEKVQNITATPMEKDISLEHTIDTKAVGAGDTPKTDAVEIATPPPTEAIINNKVQSIDSINTADDNANPNELLADRTTLPVVESKVLGKDVKNIDEREEGVKTDNVKQPTENSCTPSEKVTNISEDLK
ncbi:serine/threonine-protein phosphatase 6 regulatory subunit 3 isoform X1 [Neodiprion fabricii]|uniref:serine/threonine-protein phosphatase 6 regulatory subunit 3 isoform X1 n=2 Tax=Neodiprion fabricii TaxID=2872261 RepID=UPI001ED9289F|nr:serine/threonine-protein phosphatase 6 regulatory subunit 3 isoform X1 [Neodiprion fabricii]XP_046411017.1 serine/threonine-protein phosphatase 6 regulatory subunit 3 isoform X1 [Neodiprion fabricii]XP_046411018.1 serine/threonine-protein phosphatase 6 regulatory subunit 3 isoform X1 [Neodiprion fabricii]